MQYIPINIVKNWDIEAECMQALISKRPCSLFIVDSWRNLYWR